MNRKKTWFVTGASSGIGEKICSILQTKGCNIIAVARRVPKFEGENILCLSVDVTNPQDVDNAIQKGIAKFGNIDVLVNAAGISSYGTFEEEPIEEMRKVMEVNFWGAYNTMHSIIEHFRKQSFGTIVNISSEMGLYPRAYGAAYCSSKYALEGLSSVVWFECKNFCKVLTIELDKFDGTSIGAGKPKGVSEIKEYKNLSWLPHEIPELPNKQNVLDKAVEYIVAEAEKKFPARRLMLGKTICLRANEELKMTKQDLNNSVWRACDCAGINISHSFLSYLIKNIKSKFSSGSKKKKYCIYRKFYQYITKNFDN